MSKIYELFGYRLDAWGEEAKTNCKKAWCPFMDTECDGGGNRYLSAIDLRTHSELAKKFPGKQLVQAGVFLCVCVRLSNLGLSAPEGCFHFGKIPLGSITKTMLNNNYQSIWNFHKLVITVLGLKLR